MLLEAGILTPEQLEVEASTEEIFAAAVADGMQTPRQDLCLSGVSSLEEICRVTGDRLV